MCDHHFQQPCIPLVLAIPLVQHVNEVRQLLANEGGRAEAEQGLGGACVDADDTAAAVDGQQQAALVQARAV